MSKKIQSTTNYTLFHRHSNENRPLDLKKHRKLLESMKLYGFLTCFPIVVVRNADGLWEIKDGQHRFAIAQSLGLPVHFVEEKVNFDVAVINSTAKVWAVRDYAQKHAANGLKHYQEGLEFADQHHLPVGIAFALLAGVTSYKGCEAAFMDGTWKVRDRDWADTVAATYGPISKMNTDCRNARFLEACMAACRVEGFDPGRLIAGAEKCREKLGSYSTKDAYLDMMESVYNFNRSKLVGLKAAATMAMRERNPARPKGNGNGKKKDAA